MGRIFLSAGHGGNEPSGIDQGAIAAGTTEAREMILTRDGVLTELRSRNLEAIAVPDDQSAEQTILWINDRARPGDVALEIHAEALANPAVRGASVYYVATNTQRKQQAETLLLNLLRRVPQLPNRGARPDTAAGLGSLPFCRQVIPASLLMEIGFLSSPDDRFLLQNRRRDIALGIAEGLAAWSQAVDPSTPEAYPPCSISLNGQTYGEQGVIVNGNAFIPIDVADRLGVDLTQNTTVRRITYHGIVYVKAIDLRDFHIAVAWDPTTRTVLLKSILQICPGDLDRIYKVSGKTSEIQLLMFLRTNNEAGVTQFPDIAQIYRQEAEQEGINYDIAFSQMCVETNFLRFGGNIKPSQNNFAGLGAIGGSSEPASFPSARIGVRAHIQHLKAYATTEPLFNANDIVDPRFNFVARGIAPLVGMLSGRWTADPQYGDKVMAMLKRLYEASGLM